MTSFLMIAPSYISQIANGILILIFIYIVLSNFNAFLKTNYLTKLQIIGSLAIALGVHGTLHLGLERAYGYNPLLDFA
jgi:hypothetical protein